MAVNINIQYEGDLQCRAVHGPSNKTLATDAPVDNGGKGADFSPTDLVATAFGTCLLTIMGLAAKTMNLNLAGTNVHVIKEMTANPVRRIGALHVSVTLPPGLQLDDAQRARLEKAAWTCPVKESLHSDVALDLKFNYPA